jgi:protein SCO1
MKKFGLVGLGVVIGLALILAGWRAMSTPYTYQGSLINPPAPATNFTLTDQKGEPFQLSDQRGKIVVMFFGYSHCVDVCPAELSNYKQIIQKLGNQAQKVDFVFVTVDPQRDTPEVLGQYLAKFDPSIIGLTGARPQLEKVWKAYGVYQNSDINTISAANLDYVVDHSSILYLIDAQGNWRMTYSFGTEIDKIVGDLQHMIQVGS